MTAFNPWSLERLLNASHQAEAISGTINGKNEKYQVELKTARRAEQGDFTYIRAEIDMRRARENIFSAKQVHKLASLYGGESSLRIMLDGGSDQFPQKFFDINIKRREISGDEYIRTLRMPSGEFTPRPLLRDICRILNLRYEEREDSFYLQREQQPLLTPGTIEETYQRLQRSGYFPLISNSCACGYKGFSLYQRSVPEGVHQTVSLHVGNQFSKDNPLPSREISLLQQTLLEYCPALSDLNYSWQTETAKDLEGWEEAGMGP